MFWGETVRFCKDCKHYVTKEWSAWNMECKLDKKISSGGNTPACDKYEQRYGNNHCEDCARWTDSFFVGECNKGYPSPKGRNSDACKYFVKG